MKRSWLLLFILFAALGQSPQDPDSPLPPNPSETPDRKLPNGKSQNEAILKEDYKKNVRDAEALVKLAGELRDQIDKNQAYVLSLDTLKKTDEIEKLVKDIRNRLRRY